MVASTCEHPNETITLRGRSFQVCDHPAVVAEARVFAHEFELWHQRFFDAVLPGCDRFVDCGAYMGFSALYAAACGVDVTAFEPSRMNFQLLSLNVDMNPDLASRIGIYSHGLGARDENVTLYAHHFADREASVFPVVERDDVVTALPEATVELRAAAEVLRRAGVDGRTLLNIDIEGGEYAVLPAIKDLLADRKPWLLASFHPFNLAAERDPYDAALRRLRAGLKVAEATASYRYMHLFLEGDWCSFGPDERFDYLQEYLLQPKPVPNIASPQYGFIGSVGFSDELLPLEA